MLPIPKIFDKNSSKEKNSLYDEYFLSLVIDNKSVKAGIWRFSGQVGELLSSGSKENWEGESPEELVVSADVSIASAISKLPEISGKQPTKVLLGLPQNWLENNNLKSTKAKILQSVCKKLLIFPLGFPIIHPHPWPQLQLQLWELKYLNFMLFLTKRCLVPMPKLP